MSVSFRYFKSEKFDGNSKNMTTKDLRYNSEKIDKLLYSSFPLRPLRLYNNAKSLLNIRHIVRPMNSFMLRPPISRNQPICKIFEVEL